MSQIYQMPGHLIRRLQQISTSIFAEKMKAEGFDLTSPQFAALSLLAENPGIDQATLAGLIAHDRPTIGGVVERLVAKGLVERSVNDADRRARLLRLTTRGAETLARLRPVVERSQAEILVGLTAEERRAFIALAAKIAESGNERSRAPFQPRKLPDDAPA